MHFLLEAVGEFLTYILAWLVYHTGRAVLQVMSLGLIRVQGFWGRHDNQPEFGWLNVIWKREGSAIWLSANIAFFLGLFLWAAALTALIYYWRSLG